MYKAPRNGVSWLKWISNVVMNSVGTEFKCYGGGRIPSGRVSSGECRMVGGGWCGRCGYFLHPPSSMRCVVADAGVTWRQDSCARILLGQLKPIWWVALVFICTL